MARTQNTSNTSGAPSPPGASKKAASASSADSDDTAWQIAIWCLVVASFGIFRLCIPTLSKLTSDEASEAASVAAFCLVGFALLANSVATYLPWMFPTDCDSGAPWVQHLLYVLILMCTCPVLSVPDEDWSSEWKVPCGGWTGNPAIFYTWFVGVLVAADQYLDNNTAALAKACGEQDLWSAMVAIYVLSLLAQWVAFAFFSRDASGSFVTVVCGINTEAWVIATCSSDRNAHAALMTTRFLTESIPQAVMALVLAHRKDDSLVIVYVSVGSSILFALWAFCKGVETLRSSHANN